MDRAFVLRILSCLAVVSLSLYQVIQKQNTINYFSLQIPKLNKDLKTLEEENLKLQFEIDCFESPDHLMELSKSYAYSHLRYPIVRDVLSLSEGLVLQVDQECHQEIFRRFKTEPVLAVGVNH